MPKLSTPQIAGLELARASATTNQTFTSTAAADITGLSISFTGRSRPFIVECVLPQLKQGAAATYNVFLQLTDNANTLLAQATSWLITSATLANGRVPLRVSARFDAAPGTSFTIKARLASSSASASYVTEVEAAGTNQAAVLRAYEV